MRLVFDDNAFDDLIWWMNTDVRKAKKILSLIQETQRTPFTGKGKPEPLKYKFSGCWSRRMMNITGLFIRSVKQKSEFWLADFTMMIKGLPGFFNHGNLQIL
jgi:toxin YoeB